MQFPSERGGREAIKIDHYLKKVFRGWRMVWNRLNGACNFMSRRPGRGWPVGPENGRKKVDQCTITGMLSAAMFLTHARLIRESLYTEK